MRILFVEDDADAILSVRLLLEEAGHECKVVSFDDCESAVCGYRPDFVVLDLNGPGGSTTGQVSPGVEKYEVIWAKRFCPIVIYSADPDSFGEEGTHSSPLVERVKKGSGSEANVITAISKLEPIARGIESVSSLVDAQLQEVLKKTIPALSRDTELSTELVGGLAQRRLAALLDRPPERELHPWEQFVFPPIGESLRLGDILKKSGGSPEPGNYRVVLTPSCDLVSTGGRSPKVTHVLVATCVGVDDFCDKRQISKKPEKREDATKELKSVFNSGQSGEFVPIPCLPRQIPVMFANMKQLELVKIATYADEYERVASVDSPFREQISWAYLAIVGRPGVPDRNAAAWAESVIQGFPGGDRR